MVAQTEKLGELENGATKSSNFTEPTEGNNKVEMKLDPKLLYWYGVQVNAANPLKNRDKPDIYDSLAMKFFAPIDPVEGMLSAQMIATHNLAMMLLLRAAVESRSNLPDRFPCSQAATKLMNAFTRQLEALNQYRGRQNPNALIVGQVNVGAGGQAVVGNVTTNGAGYNEKKC